MSSTEHLPNNNNRRTRMDAAIAISDNGGYAVVKIEFCSVGKGLKALNIK